MKKKYLVWIIITILISLGIMTRLLPHPPNFSPIAAIAIFGALYLPKRLCLIIPITAMLVSDIFIGFYNPFIMLAVYSGFILSAIIGLLIRKNKKFHTVLGGTILGSFIFFLLTNAAVWIFGTLYPHNLAGLIESYELAILFFRNSLLGDLFYVGILIGGFETVKYLMMNDKKIKQKLI